MTAEEKAYQMFYNAQAFPRSGWHFGPAQAPDLHAMLIASAGTRLGIPFVSAGDTIHGYQTTYPTQSALAAAKNYALDYKLGDMQRREQLEVGTRGVLGPLAEVGTKVLYPRIQEGNGENADVAAAQVRALVAGLQGGPELNPASVLATVKHWPGEGAGGEALIVYDAVTIKYHMIPFRAAMEAGAVNIMPGYAGSSFLDPGGPGAGDSAPILAYLRQNLGFTGLITTDWLPSGSWVGAAQRRLRRDGRRRPGRGRLLDGHVHRERAGRPDRRRGTPGAAAEVPARASSRTRTATRSTVRTGSTQPAYTALANQASREAMTLLKNDGVLPIRLNAGDNIVVAGPRATDGNACCIWTSYFHQEYGSQTILDAIRARAAQAGVNVYQDTGPAPKLAVVAVGEASYTHGTNWVKEQPYLPPDQLALIRELRRRRASRSSWRWCCPGRTSSPSGTSLANAIVVTYRGGEEMGPALASLLFGDYTPRGKLPWQLPRALSDVLRPGGTDVLADAVEQWDLPYDLGRDRGAARRHPGAHRRRPAGADDVRQPALPVRRGAHRVLNASRRSAMCAVA